MRVGLRTSAVLLGLSASLGCLPAEWGAGAILYPHRRELRARPNLPFRDLSFTSGGVKLEGWFFPAKSGAARQGLLVYLHGIADNRSGAIGIAQRFTPRGWDVLAWDARAHGASGGTFCTYGFHERHDVKAALDAVGATDAVLFGSSLGAAIALQAAPLDTRVRGVIALSSFSTLRSVVEERARKMRPLVTQGDVAAALMLAERRAAFRVDEVSPLAAAAQIRVPVLLIHGLNDRDTLPAHSQGLDAALAGPHRLILVPGAGHNDALASEAVWGETVAWLAALERR